MYMSSLGLIVESPPVFSLPALVQIMRLSVNFLHGHAFKVVRGNFFCLFPCLCHAVGSPLAHSHAVAVSPAGHVYLAVFCQQTGQLGGAHLGAAKSNAKLRSIDRMAVYVDHRSASAFTALGNHQLSAVVYAGLHPK